MLSQFAFSRALRDLLLVSALDRRRLPKLPALKGFSIQFVPSLYGRGKCARFAHRLDPLTRCQDRDARCKLGILPVGEASTRGFLPELQFLRPLHADESRQWAPVLPAG